MLLCVSNCWHIWQRARSFLNRKHPCCRRQIWNCSLPAGRFTVSLDVLVDLIQIIFVCFSPLFAYQLHLQHQYSGDEWNKITGMDGDSSLCFGRYVCVCWIAWEFELASLISYDYHSELYRLIIFGIQFVFNHHSTLTLSLISFMSP